MMKEEAEEVGSKRVRVRNRIDDDMSSEGAPEKDRSESVDG